MPGVSIHLVKGVPPEVPPKPAVLVLAPRGFVGGDALSGGFHERDWWVPVDTCYHSDRSLFGGLVLWGSDFFNISQSVFMMYRPSA